MKEKLFFGEKKHSIRAAGLKTEKKFFGPRGIFAKAGHTKHLKKHNQPPMTWGGLVQYLGQEGFKPVARKRTPVFQRDMQGLRQIIQLEAREWRVLFKKTYRDPKRGMTRSLGTYTHLDQAIIDANRQASDFFRMKENPITVVGNPPKRIRANVEGVMYNKVWEVQAEKTGDHEHKGFWYHPYKGKSQVQMLALDSGDILLHSKAGKRLWRED